ncbi:iron transporter [Microtetraspora sp. NBRC 13810]|uniref:Nramp family divalent metal transporter n=1 Tax=Microtetraspora sp. NBRC 13810 TaxID=3030990 RepID=UPI0024A0DC1E|nr:Nramp family divalent metal transporter [Microtetraspora sp. NBRC 13810]GLW11823.1 iron transporter [Microtetraspora sp. NBRC 13810]
MRTSPPARDGLPALVPADLPEPLPLRRVLGPGVIAAGVGLASGEFVLWPYISANVGLIFLWAAVVGVLFQFVINMEIERYTLVTGETALTGFSRLWRHWGLVFIVLAMLANMWPGWATSSATVLTYAIGWGDPVPFAIGELVLIGVILTMAPFVYRWVERIEFVKVGAVLVLISGGLVIALTSDNRGGLDRAFTEPGIPLELGAALILGALAFAGGGGAQNLVQSNWIRDKGLGMGGRMAKLVSPVTGEPTVTPSTGYVFTPDEANLSRWRAWWKVANIEQLVSFVLITVVTITVTSMLANATLGGQDVENNVGFLQAEGQALNEGTGWFGTFFWIIGAYSLFAAALGILDYMGRLVSDALKVTYLAHSTRWTESALYVAVVWLLIAVGTVVLLAGFDQPLVLLVTSAVVGGFMMFLYSGLLVILNRRKLPSAVAVRGWRLVGLVLIFVFFGFFSALTLADQLGRL